MWKYLLQSDDKELNYSNKKSTEFELWVKTVGHYSEVIMSSKASQITSVSIVYLTICLFADQENIKAMGHWPLWGEFTGDWWITRTKGQ